ncbi:hypothetical protein ACFQ02_08285 [Seminibacterium arietis]|uniref:Uncharacterized protein n=1 Tax=Seminibacterium arietis TaxID=1173502 RepID=A0ABW3IBL2_9PAST
MKTAYKVLIFATFLSSSFSVLSNTLPVVSERIVDYVDNNSVKAEDISELDALNEEQLFYALTFKHREKLFDALAPKRK